VNSKRPVNLDISTIHLPLAAITSILHRISGVILFVGIAVLLWIFDISLSSSAGFAQVSEMMQSPLVKLVVWGVLSALAYHMVAGIKHLFLDAGIGETREAGPLIARVVVVASVILIVLLGVWVW